MSEKLYLVQTIYNEEEGCLLTLPDEEGHSYQLLDVPAGFSGLDGERFIVEVRRPNQCRRATDPMIEKAREALRRISRHGVIAGSRDEYRRGQLDAHAATKRIADDALAALDVGTMPDETTTVAVYCERCGEKIGSTAIYVGGHRYCPRCAQGYEQCVADLERAIEWFANMARKEMK